VRPSLHGGTHGLYSLAVWSDGGVPADFSFQVFRPAREVFSLEMGALVTGTLAGPGDEHRFTFQGTSGQRVYFDALQDDFTSASVTVLDLDGTMIYWLPAALFRDFGPLPLRYNGLHTVVIDSSGVAPVPYRFRLLDAAEAPFVSFEVTVAGVLGRWRLPGS
jgi:large repetitive protein